MKDEARIIDLCRLEGPCELPGGIRLRNPHAGNAHTLTLLFHRFLSQTEWRAVVEYVRQAPYVVELRADVVVEPDDNPREKTGTDRE